MKNRSFFTGTLTLATMLVFSAGVMAQGWQPLTAPVVAEFRDVDFTNAQCGTVVGENSTILRTTDGGQTWVTQTGPANEWFMAVSFATDSIGLIGGTGGTILFTQNAGAAWTTVQSGWFVTYHGAHQFSPMQGIVAGVNSIFAPLVAYTTNAWQDCTAVPFYLIDPGQIPREGTLFGVQMLSSNTGIAAAHVWDGHGAIVRTTDGGGTWSTVYWATGSLMGVDFPTPSIGYAVGISGQRIKSTDGGISWTPLSNPLRINWWDVDFVNADTGWIVGENASIYRTNDGGLTWDEQSGGTGGYLYGVDFVNSALGYAVGENGTILKTTTGGNPENIAPTTFSRLLPADSSVDPYEEFPFVRFTWSRSSDPEGGDVIYILHVIREPVPMDVGCVTSDTTCLVELPQPLLHLDELDSVYWMVLATDGIDTTFANNGPGYFFVNSLTADEPSDLACRFDLANFPNPFNAITVISFSLPQTAVVSLRIFDVTGRQVFYQSLGIVEAGNHRTTFDASGLSSGVYFARLETPHGAMNHKMVLLR